MGLLAFGLLFKKTLLLTGLTLELVLVLAQALLLLPGLCPAIIEQRQTQGQHGIDMLGSPMHARPFETGLHHELVATFPTPQRCQTQSASPAVGRSDSPSVRAASASSLPAPGSADSAWLSG